MTGAWSMRGMLGVGLLAMASVLAGCGEKAQTAGARKSDGRVWESSDTGYAASGYKASDQTAWEQQVRQRAQSQNDYARAPAKPQ